MRRLILIVLSIAAVSCNRFSDDIFRIESKYRTQTFFASGGTSEIPVRATGTFSAVSAADWCHVEVAEPLLMVSVDPIEGITERSTEVTVSSPGCKDITVDVSQISVIVNDAPSEISLTNAMLTFSVSVNSAIEVRFSYPSWISAVDDKWESGTKTYVFQASKITDASVESRKGEFVISAPEALFELSIPVRQTAYSTEAMQTLSDLWKSDMFQASPLAATSSRYALLSAMEAYCNGLGPDEFKAYLAMSDANAETKEQSSPILSCYRFVFDRILSDIQSTKVETGSVMIWHLYNMGFIVKTPSACFGMDLNHRYAAQFAPYLDFITVSHNDADHIDTALMNAMDALHKPVLSNFWAGDYQAKSPTTYTLGNIHITTCITDENATDTYCTTVHRIKCGDDAGGFEIIHTGDSSYDKSQFTACLDGSKTNLLILRFGAVAETNILGTGSGQVVPDAVLFSHLEELRHNIGTSPARASILGSIENMKERFTGTVAEGHIYVPFWGEKIQWKDGKFTEIQ